MYPAEDRDPETNTLSSSTSKKAKEMNASRLQFDRDAQEIYWNATYAGFQEKKKEKKKEKEKTKTAYFV